MEHSPVSDTSYQVLDSMPWEKPLTSRLAELRPGTLRVAYVYERAEPGTFRYRCYNMAQAINLAKSDMSASYFFLQDLLAIDRLSDYADVLVLVRVRYDSDVERLIRSFRLAGKPVLYDIDDHIFTLEATPLLVASLDQGLTRFGRVEKWVGVVGRIRHSLQEVDGIITTTAFLADTLREQFSAPVAVIPNFLNTEQWEYSRTLRSSRIAPPPDAPVIGYFSGSASHNRDYQIAEEGLAHILDRYPKARLRIAGYLEAPNSLHRFAHRIDRLPFMDFLGLQKAISEVTVNLSPLQHNAFSYSKSELKYFEAAAAGVLTVASPAPVFISAITHNHNGYLADGLSWPDVLEHALSASPDQVATRTRAALDHVEATYTPQAQAAHIQHTLRQLSST
jgi:glycosyltransferase involved in cell wall biosynthesis